MYLLTRVNRWQNQQLRCHGVIHLLILLLLLIYDSYPECNAFPLPTILSIQHLASSKVCVLQNGSVGIQPVSYIKLYRTVCVKCLISLCVFKHRVNTRAMQWIKSNFDTSFASLCLILYKMEYVQYKLSCYYKLLLRELLYVLFHITISTAIEDFRI